jgi:hypothetical protein
VGPGFKALRPCYTSALSVYLSVRGAARAYGMAALSVGLSGGVARGAYGMAADASSGTAVNGGVRRKEAVVVSGSTARRATQTG